jgi:GNAT superfamily N-acetyltransferase
MIDFCRRRIQPGTGSAPEFLQRRTKMEQVLSPQAINECFGRPANDVIRLTDGHTLAVQRWLSTRAPGAVIWRDGGVTVTSSGLSVPLFNLALGGRFDVAGEATVDEEIKALRAFFEVRGVPWLWWLGPQVCPPDLFQRLERHGLTLRSQLPALAARLPGPVGSVDPHIHVWRADTEADLKAAGAIRHVAFRFPPGQALDYFEACSDDWLKGGRPPHYARLYLARVGDGPPAAIGALVMGAGYPGVYVMATLPDWRRRGLGYAIMARLMQDANATGCDLAFLTASRFGYPLYRQFGFEHVFDYRIYFVKRA